MKYIFKSILVLFLAVFTSGCMEVIEIEGKTEIRTNESHNYKAVIVSTEYDSMDSYSWKVISDYKDYNLTSKTTSEVTFNAKSAGDYTLEVIAKKNRKSFKATIEIEVKEPEIVNGYILPPEPDEALNNSTLLGIDSNDNGVRDDVERWIFLEMEIYNGYEKIEQVIAMQKAKGYQMALIDPTNKDDKVHKATKASNECWTWYVHSKKIGGNSNRMKFGCDMRDRVFDTKERLKTYWQYDATLGGRVFRSTPTLQTKTQCEIDIDGL